MEIKKEWVVIAAVGAAVVAGMLLVGKARAADLESGRIFADAPVASRGFSWTGLYVGAHGGYGWGGASTTDNPADWGCGTNTACIAKFVGPFNYDMKGAFGGGTMGFNQQLGIVVVGLEFDAGWFGIEGKRTSASSTEPYHQNHTVDGGLYALPAARLGIAMGKAMFYGKGGYIWIDGEQQQTTTKPGFFTTTSGRMEGWAYGGGLEYALGAGWSVKAEYLRIELKDLDAAQTEIVTAPAVGHVFENHTKLDAINTVKLGLNYKF